MTAPGCEADAENSESFVDVQHFLPSALTIVALAQPRSITSDWIAASCKDPLIAKAQSPILQSTCLYVHECLIGSFCLHLRVGSSPHRSTPVELRSKDNLSLREKMRLSCLLENLSPVTGDHLTYALKALMVAVASG